MKKKQFIFLIIVITLFALMTPTMQVRAQKNTLLPFAGIVAYKYNCSCSGGLQWIWFVPLYLGGKTVLTGPVVYSPYATRLYAYFNIGQSGLWHLGDYNPGTQSCYVVAGNSCILLPAVGLMSKVGTNYSKNSYGLF